MKSIVVTSRESRMNGIIYRAAGEGAHPVALFLHGFPGNERNLDLAQAVRRAGWDAVYFNYPGSWGSGGTFSFTNALEDVAAALAWIRTPANASAHHLDPTRIALVGHSFGGWLALLSEMTSSPVGWDYVSRFDGLGTRPLLLVAATRDTPDEDPAMHERLSAAVRSAGGRLVKNVTLEDDHFFSATRLRLAELLVPWLKTDCATHQVPHSR